VYVFVVCLCVFVCQDVCVCEMKEMEIHTHKDLYTHKFTHTHTRTHTYTCIHAPHLHTSGLVWRFAYGETQMMEHKFDELKKLQEVSRLNTNTSTSASTNVQ